MKFYKTTYRIEEVGTDGKYKFGKPVWTTSDADAGTVRAAKRKEFKASEPATTPVEIEPTKAGLLEFLNEHAVH